MAAKKPTITRVRIAREELEKMTKEDFQKCWNLQEQYIDYLENKLNSGSEHTELMSLRESEEKLKQQQIEATRRENILVMRLTTKEQEMQEYAGQIQELKQAQVPSIAQLRSALLDPAVNLLFERMRKEMDALKARLEETQNELNAWKFTPDSNTGKRLMAKCRLLYQENEELGKIISSGRTAKLEGDLALQKSFSEEMKKSQSELDEFLLELDEDVEGMQSTIYYLQQQLREAKDQLLQLQQDKQKLSAIPNGSPENHKILGPDDTGDTDSQFSHGQLISGKDKLSNDSIASLSNDLNGTESLSDPITDKGSNSQQPWTPPPEKEADTNSQDVKMFVFDSAANPAVKKETSHDLPTNNASEGSDHSVIVENKNAVSHEKQIPLAERTNLVDGSDTSQTVPSRTSEHPLEVNKLVGDNEIPETVDAVTQNSSSKRTSEGGRGRKRTRPRTPVEVDGIKEDSLPVRKRTRRREAEAHQGTVEEKRTSLEIDTDTEVQVAQTLAYWASAKQERTEVQPDPSDSSLGNGELSKKGEDK